ncbi:hypothetical protein [Catenulispora subtropica]|uniref:DUF4328 domain-containing protein n=1 Tax=Catenulispora subtropica TaxID=450798 RepID=A0ABP5CIM3_9ACTN
MAGSESSTTDTRYEKAPWWAWGFVATIPFTLLALVTPWFEGAAPPGKGTFGGDNHASYYAWTVARIGIICPIFLILEGWQWYRSKRGLGWPPAPSDWRGAGRAFSSYMAGGRVKGGGGGGGYEETWYPFRTGAWMSIAIASVSLIVLGISWANFSPEYSYLYTSQSNFYEDHKMIVSLGFGGWCYLISVALFFVSGIYGVLQPVKPWWSQGTDTEEKPPQLNDRR